MAEGSVTEEQVWMLLASMLARRVPWRVCLMLTSWVPLRWSRVGIYSIQLCRAEKRHSDELSGTVFIILTSECTTHGMYRWY